VYNMVKKNYVLLAVAFIIGLVFLSAPVAADTIAINSGNGQSATAGTAVTTLPSVIVMNGSMPVSGVTVTFAVGTGGGSATGATAITGTNGIATIGSWILGTTAGSNTLTATNGSLIGSPVTFTATGLAGAATQIAVNAGNGQSATVGTAVATPPSVIVKDANGNPVSGTSVTFAIATGNGTVSGGSATTGANGIASAGGWTLGTTAGTNTLTATCTGLLGSPLMFTATGTSATSTLTITSISPTSAVNTGWQTIEIVGTGFSGSTANLKRTGYTTITGVATASTDTITTVNRNFNLIGVNTGTWTLVLMNSDGANVTASFTVNNATTATVTSISPISGVVNTSVSTTISGTGFTAASAKIRLYRSGNYIGGAVDSGGTTTQLTGTFNLNQATPGTYDVCVLPDGTDASKTCGPTFTINSVASTANGTISVKSYPTGSKAYLSNVYKGYTPITLDNITPGTYTVKVQRSGYNDWSDSVIVTAGNTSYVSASLVHTPDTTTPSVTTATPVKTVTTIKKSTLKVPTPWPSATATPASPVDPLMTISAAGFGLALVVLRKY
jgi:hypothetical protein